MPDEGRGKLWLHKETLRALQDDDLGAAVGGGAGTATRQPTVTETAIQTVCGFDPPPWVSTSPPTHMCQ